MFENGCWFNMCLVVDGETTYIEIICVFDDEVDWMHIMVIELLLFFFEFCFNDNIFYYYYG